VTACLRAVLNQIKEARFCPTTRDAPGYTFSAFCR